MHAYLTQAAVPFPTDLELIADVQKVAELLRVREYVEHDVEKIMHGNWMRFLEKSLPG